MLPDWRSGKISTLAWPATLLSGSLRAAISGTTAVSAWSSPSKSASRPRARALLSARATAAWTLPSDARPEAEQMPGELRRADGDVRQLLHRGVRHHAAVGQEEQAVLADARILELHHRATGGGDDVR